MKRTTLMLGILVALLVAGRLYLRASSVSPPGIAELHRRNGRPVRVVAPVRGDLASTVTLSGQLEPLARVPAQFEADGRLVEILPQVGTRVQRGEVVARLEDDEQGLAVQEAEAVLMQAQAALAKAEAGPRKQELELARAGLGEARAALQVAREELDRSQKLREQNAASQRQLDQHQGSYDMAEARLIQAREQLALLEEGTRKEDLAMARAAVARAQAALDRARLNLSRRVLHSPVTGVVVEVPAEPGEVVKSMPEPRRILEIEADDPVLFVAEVSELFMPSLSPATQVTVSLDALPGKTFPGKVHEISPSGNQATRSFRVEFALANPDHALRPGMFGRTRLALHEVHDLPVIPGYVLRDPTGVEALAGAPKELLPQPGAGDQQEPTALVMVATQGKAAGRLVRVALEAGGQAAIASGLEPDDQVIVEGFEDIPVGMAVQVRAQEPGAES